MGFVKIVHFWISSIFPKNSLNLDPFLWTDAYQKIKILDKRYKTAKTETYAKNALRQIENYSVEKINY